MICLVERKKSRRKKNCGNRWRSVSERERGKRKNENKLEEMLI
jgi:hypothetical protein